MTIKTNGGVFGRNPTFYNVNVDGKLTGGVLRGSSLGIGVDSLSYLAEFAKASGNTYVMVNQTGASPSAILLGAEGTKNSVYSMTGPGNFTGKDLYLYRGSSLVFNTTSANNIAFPSGQGIDFSATAGTGTSELFSDYEEGTWTPVNASITLTSASGRYTKIGDTVHAYFEIVFPVTADTNPAQFTALPFAAGTSFRSGAALGFTVDAGTAYNFVATNSILQIYTRTGSLSTNAQNSAKQYYGVFTYKAV